MEQLGCCDVSPQIPTFRHKQCCVAREMALSWHPRHDCCRRDGEEEPLVQRRSVCNKERVHAQMKHSQCMHMTRRNWPTEGIQPIQHVPRSQRRAMTWRVSSEICCSIFWNAKQGKSDARSVQRLHRTNSENDKPHLPTLEQAFCRRNLATSRDTGCSGPGNIPSSVGSGGTAPRS